MTPNSIVINYKSKQFTLDRVNTDGKYFQIGFEADRWGVRIYRLEREQVRIIIEKSVKRDDDGTSTQFMWDCYCMFFSGRLSLLHVSDPATCKRISNITKWLDIYSMLEEIYAQLKTEIDALHTDSVC